MICLVCESSFSGRPGRPNKYCSHECHIKAVKKLIEKKCQVCGRDFVGQPTRQVCSVKCVHDQMRLAKKECRKCSNLFEPEKSDSLYCSWKCMCADRSTRSRSEPEPIIGSKYVPLTKGHFAIVDDEDFEKTTEFCWYSKSSHGTMYARSRKVVDGVRYLFHLHHLVLNIPPGDGTLIDHVDGDGKNCRKNNLRIVSSSQNQMNVIKKKGRTPFKGVAALRGGRFKASIRSNNRNYYLGYFDTAEDAARAYDTKARELHGEYGRYNFPGPGERSALKID